MTFAVDHASTTPSGGGAGSKPSPFLPLIDRTDVDELNDVLAVSRTLLSADDVAALGQVTDYPSATSALDVAWRAISAALASAGRTRDQVMASTGLIDLLERVRRMDVLLREAESRRRHDALTIVRKALNRVQSVDSVSQLIELAPEIICSIGFDRAIVSRIENSMWVTQAVHVSGDAEWAETIRQVGSENPQQLGPAIRETEIVRRRTSILVTDVQTDEKVHRPVADASLSRSYVAAPVVLRNNVVGFLHADRYFHQGDTDTFDRDVLAMFSEGLTYALERSLLLSRLDGVRQEVRRFVDGLESTVSGRSDTLRIDTFGLESDAAQPERAHGAQHFDLSHRDDLSSRLTRRELEVVQLMANGDTNSKIASRLVLSEATVKSHVKHILRKLGAANRAEAVSKWLLAAGTSHTG